MEVRELMTRDPAACLPDDTCRTAGELMRSRRCGFLPGVESREGRRVIGVVTDRDIALHLAQADGPASRVPIKACMTAHPRTVAPETELEDAARAMEELAVHRLPVVAAGRLVGGLSVKAIALAARRQRGQGG